MRKYGQENPNQPLPNPGYNDGKLRKKAAYTSLAAEESSPQKNTDIVDEARDWVSYDEL